MLKSDKTTTGSKTVFLNKATVLILIKASSRNSKIDNNCNNYYNNK